LLQFPCVSFLLNDAVSLHSYYLSSRCRPQFVACGPPLTKSIRCRTTRLPEFLGEMSEQETPPPPIYIYSINTPQTIPLQFEKVFKNVDEQTAIKFKKLSESRNEVVVASERAFADAAVRGVQKYLPALFGLMEAADKLPSDFSKSLQIQWSSALGGWWQNAKFPHSNWYFEVIFVLMVNVSEITCQTKLFRFIDEVFLDTHDIWMGRPQRYTDFCIVS
jgi:hypothetical protein